MTTLKFSYKNRDKYLPVDYEIKDLSKTPPLPEKHEKKEYVRTKQHSDLYDVPEIQEEVKLCHNAIFIKTDIKQRLRDIQKEHWELQNYKNIDSLKEEVGDMLWSLIQLCNEMGWNFEELIEHTCMKISGKDWGYWKKYNLENVVR